MNSPQSTRFVGPLLLTWLALATSTTLASTITWTSNFNDLLFRSDGQPLDATFGFEIGTFAPNFTPTVANMPQWEANWLVFDRGFDPDANGWNSTEQFFVGTADHTTSGGSTSPDADPLQVFPKDATAYLWVYNSKVIAPASEWALVTDGASAGDVAADWLFPDPSDTTGTYEWWLTDADDVVFGGVNGSEGAGDFTATPAAFSLQTHASPVPEPGSALLTVLAGSYLFGRRNPNRTRR